MAWTDSAMTAFSLEAIEGLARDLISEYVASKARRNAEGLRISRLSTHVSFCQSSFLSQRTTEGVLKFTRSCPLLTPMLLSATLHLDELKHLSTLSNSKLEPPYSLISRTQRKLLAVTISLSNYSPTTTTWNLRLGSKRSNSKFVTCRLRTLRFSLSPPQRSSHIPYYPLLSSLLDWTLSHSFSGTCTLEERPSRTCSDSPKKLRRFVKTWFDFVSHTSFLFFIRTATHLCTIPSRSPWRRRSCSYFRSRSSSRSSWLAQITFDSTVEWCRTYQSRSQSCSHSQHRME